MGISVVGGGNGIISWFVRGGNLIKLRILGSGSEHLELRILYLLFKVM